MNKIKEVAGKMIKRAKLIEEQEENILISVEKLLSNGEYENATAITKTDHGGFSYDKEKELEEIFTKYRPLDKCKKCGAENFCLVGWESYQFGYKKPPCRVCETEKIKLLILNDIDNIMQARGISKRFLNADIKDFDGLKDNKSSLYISGPCGTGKTHYLAALIKSKILSTDLRIIEDNTFTVYERPETHHFPYFISVPDLLLKIRATFNNDSVTEEEIIGKFSNIGILMLDDIGSEKPTEWVLQTLYLIIDHRYREMKETYITSNLSLDQLSVKLSDRIASRIAGMCKVINLVGKDRRVVRDN